MVTFAPSSISSSASRIAADPIVNPVPVITPVDVIAPESIVPAAVKLAPLKVRAVVVPDLIIRLPLVLVALPNVVPASLKKISPPSASRTMSVVASNVMVEPESISAITGVVRVLFVKVSVAVISDTVPVRFGRVMVLSAVGSVTVRVVSFESSVEPSNTIELVKVFAPSIFPKSTTALLNSCLKVSRVSVEFTELDVIAMKTNPFFIYLYTIYIIQGDNFY